MYIFSGGAQHHQCTQFNASVYCSKCVLVCTCSTCASVYIQYVCASVHMQSIVYVCADLSSPDHV